MPEIHLNNIDGTELEHSAQEDVDYCLIEIIAERLPDLPREKIVEIVLDQESVLILTSMKEFLEFYSEKTQSHTSSLDLFAARLLGLATGAVNGRIKNQNYLLLHNILYRNKKTLIHELSHLADRIIFHNEELRKTEIGQNITPDPENSEYNNLLMIISFILGLGSTVLLGAAKENSILFNSLCTISVVGYLGTAVTYGKYMMYSTERRARKSVGLLKREDIKERATKIINSLKNR